MPLHSNREDPRGLMIEERILLGLRQKRIAPELVSEFIAEFYLEVSKRRKVGRTGESGEPKQPFYAMRLRILFRQSPGHVPSDFEGGVGCT